MLDLYLLGPIRLSGGAIYTTADMVLAGEITGSIDINGITYTPTEVGTLTGTVITKELSPYAGIGLGNPAGRSRIGFFLDLGVAFHGTPAFTLTATGSSVPQAELDAEAQSIQDDLTNITVYPVVKVGFYIGFWRGIAAISNCRLAICNLFWAHGGQSANLQLPICTLKSTPPPPPALPLSPPSVPLPHSPVTLNPV